MNQSTKNVIMYFMLLIGLFILLFFTKSYYEDYMIKTTNVDELTTEKEDLEKQIKEFKDNEKKIKKGGNLKIAGENIDKKTLKKYIVNFTENNFLKYFYSLGNNIEIESISLDKGKLDKNGFKKGTIKLGVAFESEEQMKQFLSKILSDDSRYRFYIEEFSFPIGKMKDSNGAKINIKLVIYYKDKTIKIIKKIEKKENNKKDKEQKIKK